MGRKSYLKLSQRERQMMDVLYQQGKATAAEIRANIPNPPSYSAVRAKLSVMEEKGYIDHEYDGPRYVYRPIVKRENAERTAVSHLMETFFDNSIEKAVTALFEHNDSKLSAETLDQLEKLIARTRGDSND